MFLFWKLYLRDFGLKFQTKFVRLTNDLGLLRRTPCEKPYSLCTPKTLITRKSYYAFPRIFSCMVSMIKIVMIKYLPFARSIWLKPMSDLYSASVCATRLCSNCIDNFFFGFLITIIIYTRVHLSTRQTKHFAILNDR